MGWIREFKEFALKGNVVELAIAVILGAAFGKIVTALTTALIMPLISMVLGESSVGAIYFKIGKTVFPVGTLMQAVIDFVLVALVLFGIIKTMNRLNRKKEEVAVSPEPELTLSEKLLMEIRDGLKK